MVKEKCHSVNSWLLGFIANNWSSCILENGYQSVIANIAFS